MSSPVPRDDVAARPHHPRRHGRWNPSCCWLAGQLAYGVRVWLAPTWFDPGEAAGIITPYMLLYGLHDALVKAMPDNK
jgi:hypothetical protein